MPVMTAAKSSVGRRSGRVMPRKRCQRLGAVDLGGLVQVPRDRLQAGQEDDHQGAEAVPHGHGDEGPQREALVGQPAGPVDAEDGEDPVDEAGLGARAGSATRPRWRRCSSPPAGRSRPGRTCGTSRCPGSAAPPPRGRGRWPAGRRRGRRPPCSPPPSGSARRRGRRGSSRCRRSRPTAGCGCRSPAGR